jgi:hypothetical protein
VTSTLSFDVGRLLDVDGLTALLFELLEVAELIEPADAVLQRLGVEHAALDQPHLAADDVVARGRVAGEGDAVDEVLLALLQPHRHVDGGLRRAGHRAFGRRLWNAEVGIAGELEVAAPP